MLIVEINKKEYEFNDELEVNGFLKGLFREVPEIYTIEEITEWVASIGYEDLLKIK